MFQIVPRSGVKAKPNSYYSFFPIPTCPPKYSQYHRWFSCQSTFNEHAWL